MKLDPAFARQLKDYVANTDKVDSTGRRVDLEFLSSDGWLQDSAVIDRVVNTNGTWAISLVFADVAKAYKFIVRQIRTCTNFNKALMTAQFMRRLAAKDPRGTLKVKGEHFLISDN